MAICEKLENFLKDNRVEYKVVKHPEAYTAQEIAASMHVPGKELAKVVIVKVKDKYIMTVMPASWRIDFNKLKEILGEEDVRLATEEEFRGFFPDCEPGAEPPFGNLYNLETYVDKSLTEDEHIFFNSGNHYEAVEMTYRDYERLVHPRVADFAVHLH